MPARLGFIFKTREDGAIRHDVKDFSIDPMPGATAPHHRHCEEQSDEAIQSLKFWIASLRSQ